MLNKATILEKLEAIIDPDFNKNIVELGFVKDLSIDKGIVQVTIELTTPACPIKEEFKKQAEDAIGTLPSVKKVEVTMTAKKANSATSTRQNNNPHLKKIANIVGIASCKGGVGKSTIAALLASELSARNFKVGLFDTDIFGPSLPALFNLFNGQVYMKDNFIQPITINDNLKVMSFGFLLKENPAIMRGAMVSNYIVEMVNKVEWGELDYLFIDMPPGTGDVQLTLSQNMPISGVVMVTTAHLLSLVDVKRGMIMFEKVNVPVLSVVQNMSYFICHKCGEKNYLFGETSLKENLGVEDFIELPFLKKDQTTFTPFTSSEPSKSLCDKIVRIIGKKSTGLEQPPEVTQDEQFIYLHYPEKKLKVSHFVLRSNCGCALCKDEMTGEVKIDPKSIPKDIKPVEITPLGNYALSINWSDGHTSGIYPYKLIQKLQD